MKLFEYKQFILEKKSNQLSKLKDKLKEEAVDMVEFDGEQHKVDVDKMMKFLKKNLKL